MHTYATAVDLSVAGAGMDYGRVRGAGYSIVLRYLGGDTRCLTVPERDRIYGAGLRLGVIGQRGIAARPRGGYPAGREDGAYYEQWADRMGVPADQPILCAIADVGGGFPTVGDLPVISAFLQGLWETISRQVGIYGPYWVLEHFRDDPRVFCFWQTAGSSGSGSGTGGSIHNECDGSWRRLSDRACMYQECGSVAVPGTDHNAVLMPDYHDFTHHPSDQPEEPEEDDDDMALVQIAHCDTRSVPRIARLLEARGTPVIGRASFFVCIASMSMRFIPTGEAVDFWVRLGNWAAALKGLPQNTDLGFVNDPLYWEGFSLDEDDPPPGAHRSAE